MAVLSCTLDPAVAGQVARLLKGTSLGRNDRAMKAFSLWEHRSTYALKLPYNIRDGVDYRAATSLRSLASGSVKHI